MTDSFPPGNNLECFLVPFNGTTMSATDGTNDTNNWYPCNDFYADIRIGNDAGTDPTADDTITVGSVTYTYKAVPGAANEVDLHATNAHTSADNLRQAIIDGNVSHGEDTSGGSTYHAGTVINPDIRHAEHIIEDGAASSTTIHVTASTALTVGTTGANINVEDMGRNAITTMVQSTAGYTSIAAHSSSTSGPCTVYGVQGGFLDGIATSAAGTDRCHIFSTNGNVPIGPPITMTLGAAATSDSMGWFLKSDSGIAARIAVTATTIGEFSVVYYYRG